MDVTWHDLLSPDLLVNRGLSILLDLFEPIAPLAGIKTESKFGDSEAGGFTVETTIEFTGPLLGRRAPIKLISRFDYLHGLVSIIGSKSGKVFLEITQEGAASAYNATDAQIVPELNDNPANELSDNRRMTTTTGRNRNQTVCGRLN
jgi:hypothetical protein